MGLNATEAIDNRISTINTNDPNAVNTAKLVFSIQHHGGPGQPPVAYVRNTLSWCYDLRQQMTCISPWNDEGSNIKPGTAITAQHIITAKHFHLHNNDAIRFITANAGANNPEGVVLRTIRGSADQPGGDVTIHTLDSPLPPTITPCKVLPANYASYLSYLGGGRPPVMYLDQEEKALVQELRALDLETNLTRFVKPLFHPNRLPFNELLINNDSGNPAFLIINDTLVLLSTALFYGTGDSTFVTNMVPSLNAMIVAADANTVLTGPQISTGLQVQTVDLSGFSMFTPPPP